MDVLEQDIRELNLKAGSPFIVMEHIPNNLYKYVESQRTPENKGLPLGLVWNFVRQMANGLYYLHSLSPPVSHRDLKPDNILASNTFVDLLSAIKLALVYMCMDANIREAGVMTLK